MKFVMKTWELAVVFKRFKASVSTELAEGRFLHPSAQLAFMILKINSLCTRVQEIQRRDQPLGQKSRVMIHGKMMGE